MSFQSLGWIASYFGFRVSCYDHVVCPSESLEEARPHQLLQLPSSSDTMFHLPSLTFADLQTKPAPASAPSLEPIAIHDPEVSIHKFDASKLVDVSSTPSNHTGGEDARRARKGGSLLFFVELAR